MRILKPCSERPAVLHQLDFDNVDVEGRRPVRRSGSAIPHSREDVIACECIPDLLGMHDLSLEVDGIPMAGLEDGNLHYLNFIEDGGDLIVPIWLAEIPDGSCPVLRLPLSSGSGGFVCAHDDEAARQRAEIVGDSEFLQNPVLLPKQAQLAARYY